MSGKERDSIQSLKIDSSLEIHYFTVFAMTKPRCKPSVVARLGLPDFAELGFVDFVY